VLSGPARSGLGNFEGACSGYLARQPAGSQVQAFVSDPHSPFRLPDDPAIPIILIGPGTGLAPMRAFLQERAAQQAAGARLGRALLFFGCRHPEQDYLYQDELQDWEARGVVQLRTAFSRLPGQPKRYVQDELRTAQDEVWALMESGAAVYVCGDARHMAPGVRQAFADIFRGKTSIGEAVAEAWLNDLANSKRYLTDVWAAS
jgi:cytochrome P450/NADPH-cytochrome P450 reductase